MSQRAGDTCASCGRPIVDSSALLCDCGASLSPSTQAAAAFASAAATPAAGSPHPSWLILWLASLPFQVVIVLAALLPSSRVELLEIHSTSGALLILSAPAALTQPVYLVSWLVLGKTGESAFSTRRVAAALALICSLTVLTAALLTLR